MKRAHLKSDIWQAASNSVRLGCFMFAAAVLLVSVAACGGGQTVSDGDSLNAQPSVVETSPSVSSLPASPPPTSSETYQETTTSAPPTLPPTTASTIPAASPPPVEQALLTGECEEFYELYRAATEEAMGLIVGLESRNWTLTNSSDSECRIAFTADMTQTCALTDLCTTTELECRSMEASANFQISELEGSNFTSRPAGEWLCRVEFSTML